MNLGLPTTPSVREPPSIGTLAKKASLTLRSIKRLESMNTPVKVKKTVLSASVNERIVL